MRTLSVSDLAKQGSLQPLAYGFDAEGAPQEVLALVDLDGELPDPLAIEAASAAAADSTLVLVGVARSRIPTLLQPVIRAMALTITDTTENDRPEFIYVASVDEEIAALKRSVFKSPLTAAILVGLLRLTPVLGIKGGLVAESFAYSSLQAGPEFSRWLAARRSRVLESDAAEPVLVEREDETLNITLNRPHKHNAYNFAMRDALIDALTIAVADPSVASIEIRGNGPSFCSGGDLDEFGTAPDPVTAHLVRVTQSAAWLMSRCADRARVHVHGACIGAGVELPAFASWVVATPDSFFRLPEIGMGLIPGGGGTVSVPRRIGRWRTAYLGLSGRRLEAEDALGWGLIDEVERL